MRRAAALATLTCVVGVAQASPARVALAWRSGEAMQDVADRALAGAWMKRQYYCGIDAEACNDFEFARVASPRGALLALRTASGGTCGTYEVALFGPVVTGGRRPTDSPVFADCASEIELHAARAWPEIHVVAKAGYGRLVSTVWR